MSSFVDAPPLARLYAVGIPFLDNPPPIPSLCYTPSTSAPMQMQGYNGKQHSRWNCASKAIGTFLKLTEKDKVYIFLYDSTSQQVTGNIQELTSLLQTTHADGGTSFQNVMQSIDSLWKTLSIEEQEKCSKFLLTDGEDNGSVLFNIENPENLFFRGFFDSVMAIGHESTFSKKTVDLLSFFSGDKKDVLRFCETEEDVVDGIRGDCFAMATTQMKNVILDMIVVNDDQFVAPYDSTVEYLSEEEWTQKVNTDQELLSEIQYQYHNGVFVLSPVDTHIDIIQGDPKIYIVALDKSGSMTTMVNSVKTKLKPLKREEEEKNYQPYVHISMTVSSFTPSTYIPVRGTIKGIWATFTSKKDVKHGRVDCGIIHTEQIMDIAKEMLVLNDSLSVPIKKKQVQELYKEHFTFPHRLKKMPQWIQAQGTPVWNMITERYRRTLSGLSSKSFCEQSAIPLSTMLRATTSTAASTQANEEHFDFPDMNLCKICFVNPPSILFTKCSHVGMCGECYESNVASNDVKTCPFCREEDIGHSTLQLEKGVCCLSCERPCSYVGICGHALYCNGCKVYKKSDVYDCLICENPTHAVPILLC